MLDPSELKPLIFLEMNYFLFIKKGIKGKEVKNVIICCRKNYMAISVSQVYVQGADRNSDAVPDFCSVSAALPVLPICFSALPLRGFLLAHVLCRLSEEALGIILCPE